MQSHRCYACELNHGTVVLVLQLVFTEVALGAVVLTVNTILLGGNIVFFQSLCLIGYCLFPIDIAAIVCLFVKIGVS